MVSFKSRRMLWTILPAAAALALVLVLVSLSPGTANAQGYTPTTPAPGQPIMAGSSGSCVAYDSYCAYCASSMADICKAFVPAHASGTTAVGAENNAHNAFVMGVDAGCSCSPNISPLYLSYRTMAFGGSGYIGSPAYGMYP